MRFLSAMTIALLALVSPLAATAAAVPLEDLIRHPEIHQVKISPTGSHMAVARSYEGERVLVIMSLSPLKITGSLRFRGKEEVGEFYWANDERVVAEVMSRRAALEAPVNYGSLFAINADGSRGKNIFGYAAGEQQLGTRIKKAEATYAHATIIDPLVDDKNEILISTSPWARDFESHGDVHRLNIYTGVRKEVVGLPQVGGRAFTDGKGNLLFANGTNRENKYELYGKADNGWTQVTHPLLRSAYPVGYDHANSTSYLVVDTPDDTETLVTWDGKKNIVKKVLQHEIADITDIIRHPRTQKPLGVYLNPDYPTVQFFDEGEGFAPFYRGLKKAFEGYHISFTSFTRDGKKGVLQVSGDRLPSDYFLVDLASKKVDFLLSSADWLDPQKLNPMRAESFEASDGLRISTYLTFPAGTEESGKLPMVVMPHGGPHARDFWGYTRDAQILSQNGYLVLQVNFRGSTGFGNQFLDAGKNEWGGAIQRDIAEAVQWAVAQGHADADRVCIYGASFGGYSALMNPIRYPELYQCAAGYVGVYDLELLYKKGDIRRRDRGVAFLGETIGQDPEVMRANSPLYHTDKLNLPLFIIHGEEDERAPVAHAEAMLEELEKNGKPAKSLIVAHEGHGFYNEDNRRLMYTQLLSFLDANIGVGAAEQ
ncbi:S9 family peptidase [Microbulbifer elongatus]|uniref:S9 family peptidase n=1 Tax=Microbulbifer elongatus TaxID=86173 RepID=A0ABT1P064_9GAMM|nr:prolyl oligopeptidase family serine peptidase [Microbulbifer elongatus]MCQ3829507.1 S9 family peptidase [Microbulbifer elongatus]